MNYEKHVSKRELRMRQSLDEDKIPYQANVSSVIPPYELDLYFPDRGVAVEFNSCWYHSQQHKDVEYHFRKSSLAMDRKVDLYHVWDETPIYWVRRFTGQIKPGIIRHKNFQVSDHHSFAETFFRYWHLYPDRWTDNYLVFTNKKDMVVGLINYTLSENTLYLESFVTDPRWVNIYLVESIFPYLVSFARDNGCVSIEYTCSRDYYPRYNYHPLAKMMYCSGISRMEPCYYRPPTGDESNCVLCHPDELPNNPFQFDECLAQSYFKVVRSGLWDFVRLV